MENYFHFWASIYPQRLLIKSPVPMKPVPSSAIIAGSGTKATEAS